MKITKLALVATLLMGAGSAYAGFVDSRANDALVEVNYKSIAVEDLAADIAPHEYTVTYARPEQRKQLLQISGKGTWSQLLSQAASTSPLMVYVDHNVKSIKFSERSAVATPAVVAAAGAAGARVPPAPAVIPAVTSPPVSPASAPTSVVTKPALVAKPLATPALSSPIAFTTTSSDYQVSAVLQRWAAQANMQYVWEPRNVEFLISAENDWGTDLRQAVRDLLMSVQAGQSAQAGRESVRACIHPNKPKNVLRIIRFNERCAGAM